MRVSGTFRTRRIHHFRYDERRAFLVVWYIVWRKRRLERTRNTILKRAETFFRCYFYDMIFPCIADIVRSLYRYCRSSVDNSRRILETFVPIESRKCVIFIIIRRISFLHDTTTVDARTSCVTTSSSL